MIKIFAKTVVGTTIGLFGLTIGIAVAATIILPLAAIQHWGLKRSTR